MNVLYFYSEVMGYTLAVIESLVKDHGANVHVVYWDKKKNTPFQLPAIEGVSYYKRSETDLGRLRELIDDLSPVLLYISGRMDKDYLKASTQARKQGTVVISGFDAQWKPSLKNRVIALAGAWLYKKYFDYIWVPGPYQYEFARKLGYSKHNIIWNLLSANTGLFKSAAVLENRKKQFVFAGRFVTVKGVDLLIKVFLQTKQEKAHDWQLLLIGNGPLKETFTSHPDIAILDFLQPHALAEKTKEGGVFVLPSIHEPWGVVLHEYAAAGFPIICSDACGAAVTFVKNNYNGFVFESGNTEALKKAMTKVIEASPAELNQMGIRSQQISQFISPQVSAAAMISVLK